MARVEKQDPQQIILKELKKTNSKKSASDQREPEQRKSG
jgi:hypothetical protein